ncbi:hypothetical protein BGZ51_000960, partial [Haplosporangium sp. Z 767]
MHGWLNDDVSKFDPGFMTWFKDLLDVCTWKKHFTPFGYTISLSDALLFAGTEWMNDGGLDGILSYFRHKYSDYLFIPLFQISHWKDSGHGVEKDCSWNWKQAEVRDGRYRKAYAFVHMENHWGALSVDFERCEIAFGDSMNKAIPQRTIRGVLRWLELCLDDEEFQKWVNPIAKLFVRPQIDGGSCGIHAANAIEFDINRTRENTGKKSCSVSWSLGSAKEVSFHRTRYLKFVVGFQMVERIVHDDWERVHPVDVSSVILSDDDQCQDGVKGEFQGVASDRASLSSFTITHTHTAD